MNHQEEIKYGQLVRDVENAAYACGAASTAVKHERARDQLIRAKEALRAFVDMIAKP